MKSTQLGSVALLLISVLGCGRLGELVKNNGSSDVLSKHMKIAEETLRIDVLADPPSPGAAVVGQLARLDPEAASLQKTVENLERSAIKEFAEKLTEEYNIDRSQLPSAQQRTQASVRRELTLPFFSPGTPVVGMLQSGQASPQIGISPNDINFTVAVVSIFNDMVAQAVREVGSKPVSKRQYNGTSYTDMSVEIGHGADGSNKFGFKMNTRGIAGNRTLDSDFEASIDGQRCPQLDGSVYFTVKVKLSGKHADSSYIQDVTAKVIAKTNDEADLATYEMKVNQGIQETGGGRNSYIESEFEVTDGNETPPRTVRISQDTGPHADELAKSGYASGIQAGMTGLRFAEAMWKNGGCVAIEAKSPGNVQPSSVTEIPVDVKHKYDGSSMPSKVTVELKGETSVSPMQLDQTPGRLSYAAPPEADKSATIKLEARSKRGRAKLDLNATTVRNGTTGGNSYDISGSIDDASMSGRTCDSSRPFTIGGTLQFQFTPTSPKTGNYTYKGPFSATGSGPYVINDDGSMKLDGTGCIMGGNCATYSHKWRATPIAPGSCGK